MKILITGVAGFLGSRLAEEFKDHTVIGIDNLTAGERENVPHNVAFYAIDCESKYLREVMKGVDVVYHCAAHPHEGLSVFSPHVVCKSIYEASVAVFSAAAAEKVSKVVYCSSMSRYGASQTPFIESYYPRPADPYAIAKVAAEDTLRVLSATHGFEHVIAVPHNIVGRNQKYDDPFRNVCAIMANRMLMGKKPIVYGNGKQTRCFSDVRDVLPVMRQLMDAPNGEVYNIGPDEEVVEIEKMGRMLADIIGCKWDPIRLPDRPCEVKHAYCSSDKIRDKFGYKTTYSLQETLESLVDYIVARGPRQFNYYLPVEIRNEKTPKWWTGEIE